MKIPDGTDARLYAVNASNLFTSPNLDKSQKPLDLLCIGAMSKGPTGPYGPRIDGHKQVLKLAPRFKVSHSHKAQFGFASTNEPLSDERRFLNFYSKHLGQAKFVFFGPCQGLAKEALLIKYYEVLGCGAIPIMPTVADLGLIGVEPNVHYLPFDRVANDNRRLEQWLDQYDRFYHIARNATQWHRANADSLLFDHFEDMVSAITSDQYPQRLI